MPRIFYINLDRVPQRAEFMESQLSKLGLIDCVQRIPAIDAAVEGSIENSGYAPCDWRPRWNVARTLVAGFTSHRIAWQQVVDGHFSSAVIMEDDLLFSAELPEAVRQLENSLESFDVVKLDGADQSRRYGPALEFGSVKMRPILQEVPSAAAYMVTLGGARRLLELSERFADHIDDFIFRPRTDWRCFQLFPAVGVQGMFCHESATADCSWLVAKSERVSNPALNAGVEKGPYSYRVSKQIVRSLLKVQQKLGGDRLLEQSGGFIGRPTLAADLGPYESEATKSTRVIS